MKHIDEHIRDVFSEKLGNYEVPVSPELWNAVQAKITSPAGGSAAAVGSKFGIWMKAGIASLVVVGIAATSIFLQNDNVKPQDSQRAQPSEQSVVTMSDELSSTEGVQETTTGYNISTANEDVMPASLDEGEDYSSTARAETREIHPTNEVQSDAKTIGTKDGIGNLTPSNISVIDESWINTREEEIGKTREEKVDHVDYHLNASFEVKKDKNERLEIAFTPELLQAANYHWDFGDGNTSNQITPSHVYDEEGEYVVKLTVSDKNQRIQESEQNVSVYKPGAVIVPNVFTPNGDGVNDVFDPMTLSKSVEFERVIIFDAKGKSIYESAIEYLWDGKDSRGNYCEPGQYQYIIVARDRNHQIIEKKGYVTLIR